MGDLDNAPMPPMGADDDMGMDDPMGGAPDDMGGDEPPMGGPDDMGEEDPMGGPDDMGGDEPPMGGDSDDDELMNIVDGMSTEDKAAVIKYAKSMVNDSEDNIPSASDEMPMESVRNYKGIIDEVINDVLDNQEGTKRPGKRIPKEYNGMKSPFKSPY